MVAPGASVSLRQARPPDAPSPGGASPEGMSTRWPSEPQIHFDGHTYTCSLVPLVGNSAPLGWPRPYFKSSSLPLDGVGFLRSPCSPSPPSGHPALEFLLLVVEFHPCVRQRPLEELHLLRRHRLGLLRLLQRLLHLLEGLRRLFHLIL